MKTIRSNVFETNSSSTHSIAIPKNCEATNYVYGCEQDCEYKDCRHSNNYKDFIPTEPLHDKSISGV